MAKSELPSPDALRQLLDYDAGSGLLYWRERDASWFKHGKRSADDCRATWNKRFAFKPALNYPDARGYLTGCILSHPLKAHRVVWAMVTDCWPSQEIDHIDGNPSNNRFANLRDVSHSINSRNARLQKNNTTGFCGLFQRPSGRWGARVTIDGKTEYLGTYDSRQEAIEARGRADGAYSFHANHGRKL